MLAVVEQLQGFELAAGAWERVLGSRAQDYRVEWLDDLCLAGDVTWARLSVRNGSSEEEPPRRSGMTVVSRSARLVPIQVENVKMEPPPSRTETKLLASPRRF